MNIIRIASLVLVMTILPLLGMFAQPTFNIGSASGNQGEEVSIDITVDNFDDLIGILFRLQWDPSVATFAGIDDVNSTLNGLNTSTPPQVPEGQLNVSWFDVQNPTTFDNGTLLLSIRFNLIGAVGSSTDLSFDLNPDRLEAIRSDDPTTNIGANVNNGALMILGGGGNSFNLIIDDYIEDQGESFCIPVRVQNFTNVKALEMNINWDPAIIQYDRIEGFNLPGLDASKFNETNTGAGELRLAWVANDPTNGESLANNSSLFDICVTAIGASGSRTDVTMTDIVSEPSNPSVINGSVQIQGPVEGFALQVNDTQGPMGGEMCFDITVQDFIGIRGLQLSMHWDSTNFKFSRITNIHPDFEPAAVFGTPGTSQQVDQGQITVIWTDVSGLTLANQTVLYTLCLNDTGGDCGDEIELDFGNAPTPVLVVDQNGQIPSSEVNLVAGVGTIACGPNVSIISVTDASCHDSMDGSILVDVQPADGMYTFMWNTTPVATTQNLTMVGGGTYTLTVTDIVNDVVIMITESVDGPDPILIDGTITQPTMGANGEITINSITGGTGSYTCEWTPTVSNDCMGASGLGPGSYTITVTDDNNCTAQVTFEIVDVMLGINVMSMDAACAETDGACDGTIDVTAIGLGPFVYLINGQPFSGSAEELCAGSYTVSVTDETTQMTLDTTIIIDAPDPISFDVNVQNASGPGIADGGASVSNIMGGIAPYMIEWLDIGSELDSVVPDFYIVTVSDENGCMRREMIEIDFDMAQTDCFAGIPVMTPNGDGKNDPLVINCASSTDNQLLIFNRWGQLVFSQSNYDNTWLGISTNNEPLPDGVYYWILTLNLGQQDDEYRGYVDLIRNLR